MAKTACKIAVISPDELLCSPEGQRDLCGLIERNQRHWAQAQGARLFHWLSPETALEIPLKWRLEDPEEEAIDPDEDDPGDPDTWMLRPHPFFETPENAEEEWLDATAITDSLRTSGLVPLTVFRLMIREGHGHNDLAAFCEELIEAYRVFALDPCRYAAGYLSGEWMSDELVANYLRRWSALPQHGDILNLSSTFTAFYALVYCPDREAVEKEGDGGEEGREEEEEDEPLPSVRDYRLKPLMPYQNGYLCPEPGLSLLLAHGPNFWRDTPVQYFAIGASRYVDGAGINVVGETVERIFHMLPDLPESVTIDGVKVAGRISAKK